MENPCIIVFGSPIYGFSYVGPFESMTKAIEYAEEEGYQREGESWWIAAMDKPGVRKEYPLMNFVVLYREKNQDDLTVPLAFVCQAESGDHAEEQCLNAYPDARIVWIIIGKDVREALQSWWSAQ